MNFFLLLFLTLLPSQNCWSDSTLWFESTPVPAKVEGRKENSAAKYNLGSMQPSQPELVANSEQLKIDTSKKQIEEKARRFWRDLDWIGGDLNRIWLETEGRDVVWYNVDNNNATFSSFSLVDQMRSQTVAIGNHGADFNALSDALTKPNQIQTTQSLNLRSGKIGVAQVATLVKIAPSLSHLLDLYLGNNNLGDDGVKVLSTKLLPMLLRLEVLDLEGNNISAKGIAELIKVLPRMTRLRALYLGSNNLNDEAVAQLVKVMPAMRSLRIFSVRSSKFGAIGAKSLTSSLSYLLQLQVLDLSSNNLGTAQAEDVARILPNLQQLMYFDLEANKFDDKSKNMMFKSSSRIAKFKEMIF